MVKSVTAFIEGKLKLRVHREKSAVDRPWKREFQEAIYCATDLYLEICSGRKPSDL